jgi:hypothetical protein
VMSSHLEIYECVGMNIGNKLFSIILLQRKSNISMQNSKISF